MLVIELDGSQHYNLDGTVVSTDEVRSAYMERLGWRVLRFTNRDVLVNTDGVLEEILRALEACDA